MTRILKLPTLKIGTLIAILMVELLIIDVMFMFCIVDVYAAQIQEDMELAQELDAEPEEEEPAEEPAAEEDPPGLILFDIPLSDELQRYTFIKCAERGLSYEMVIAMMHKESRFKEDAVSSTHDYGILQINRSNHGWLSESLGITDFLDARQCIDAGTFHLKGIMDNGYSDLHKVLMVYNLGGNKARDLWSQGINTSPYSYSVLEYMESLKWRRRNGE